MTVSDWKMLTLVGEDRPGIVARVTAALYRAGWNLGEASMIRLGGNFTIMMMVSGQGSGKALEQLLQPVSQSLGLQVHVDAIGGGLHRHLVPNLQVRVVGADRAGIVAKVTGALAEAGFNILDLESDVAGTEQKPVYIMLIQGYAAATVEALQQAVDAIGESDMEVQVSAVETLIG
jgi:glycine cleavage system transcriptional repressor